MEIVRLGWLHVTEGERLVFGDPCYFDDSPHAFTESQPKWQTGKYPVYLAFEQMRPHALIVMANKSYNLPSLDRLINQVGLREIATLSVDSGQIAVITESTLKTWVETDRSDFRNPKCDYDYASVATLQRHLGADFLENRLISKGSNNPSEQIGTAVCSSTAWGDGVYPLYSYAAIDGTVHFYLVDLANMIDEDEEDDRDCGPGEEYNDEGCVEVDRYNDEG